MGLLPSSRTVSCIGPNQNGLGQHVPLHCVEHVLLSRRRQRAEYRVERVQLVYVSVSADRWALQARALVFLSLAGIYLCLLAQTLKLTDLRLC